MLFHKIRYDMKQVKRNKKQIKDASREIHVMLKRAVNTKVPVILDSIENTMNPELIHLTEEDLDQYSFEILNSSEKNISSISDAKNHVRLNRAVNAFRKAGIAANTYSHIGYYQVPLNEEKENDGKKYRYML